MNTHARAQLPERERETVAVYKTKKERESDSCNKKDTTKVEKLPIRFGYVRFNLTVVIH